MGMKEELSKQITRINMKTSTFLEENKIKTFIDTLNKDIQELYRKAGGISFEEWKNPKEDVGNPLPAIFEEIQAKYNLIAEQEKQLQELIEKTSQVLGESPDSEEKGGKLFCPNCGSECLSGANFCKKCGTKLR